MQADGQSPGEGALWCGRGPFCLSRRRQGRGLWAPSTSSRWVALPVGCPVSVPGCGLEGPVPRGAAASAPGSWQRDVQRGVRPLCTCTRRSGGGSRWGVWRKSRSGRGEERRWECGMIRVKVTCEPWDGARGATSAGAAGTGVSFRSWGRSVLRRSQGRARPQRGRSRGAVLLRGPGRREWLSSALPCQRAGHVLAGVAAPLTTWLFTFLPRPQGVLPDPEGLRPGPWCALTSVALKAPGRGRVRCRQVVRRTRPRPQPAGLPVACAGHRGCPLYLTAAVRAARAKTQGPPDRTRAAERGLLRAGPRGPAVLPLGWGRGASRPLSAVLKTRALPKGNEILGCPSGFLTPGEKGLLRTFR